MHGLFFVNRKNESKGSFLLTRILALLAAVGCRVQIPILVISAGSFQKHKQSSFLPQVDVLMDTNIVEDLGGTGLLTYCGGAP